jgi:hypothetical protein
MKDRTIRPYVVDRVSSGGVRSSNRTRRCGAEACNLTTREGKEFCPEHIGNLPYVQRVLRDLQLMEDEVKRVSKRGWKEVDVKAQRCHEIMTHLATHGARTEERLLREVFASSCPIAVVSAYSDALHMKRMVNLGKTSRGSTVVSLP